MRQYGWHYLIFGICPRPVRIVSVCRLCWRQNMCYCGIICFHWTFNFLFFVGRAINEFKITTKYFSSLVKLRIIRNHKFKCLRTCSLSPNHEILSPMKLHFVSQYVTFVFQENLHCYKADKTTTFAKVWS